jgi:hypothetical protein
MNVTSLGDYVKRIAGEQCQRLQRASVIGRRVYPHRNWEDSSSIGIERSNHWRNVTCQRGSARQCCKGHVSFLWEKPIFDPSHKPYPLSYNRKNLRDWLRCDLNRCANFHCNRLDKGAPTHTWNTTTLWLFFFWYFVIFCIFFSQSHNGRTERRTNVHDGSNDAASPRTCLFGVSLMHACIKGSRIQKKNPKFRPLWDFQA